MTRTNKIILIMLVVISFSCGITYLVAAFYGFNPKVYLGLSLISFLVCKLINEDILDSEECDETF